MESGRRKSMPLVGIIGGTSQFGQWFRFFFEKNNCRCLVAGRRTKMTSEEIAKKADIVIVSVPVRETENTIRKVRDLVKADALLCDFTSIKEKPLTEMMKRKKGGVLGMHPLFGPLVPSMKGQIVVFCEGRKSKWVSFLKKVFERHGGKITWMNPKEHDRQMAMIQAMTHFLNITFARVLQKQKIEPQNIFSTPVFRLQAILAGRVLGANSSLYADLEIENKAFHKILKEYVVEVRKLSGDVLSKNHKKFEEEFKSAAKAMKGFIPIAQAKTTEIMYILDKQPIEIRKRKMGRLATRKNGTTIACLGPEGTYSHLASKDIFQGKSSFIMAPTIRQVFGEIKNGEAEFGVVPAENLIAGIVQETLDSLFDYPLEVVGSYKKDIHHCLLARNKNWEEIKTIKSHIQPLNQCKEWLSKNFPDAILSSQSSSVEAILSTDDPAVAFVAGEEAAKKYKLAILASNIEDNKNNFTEFYILSKSSGNEIRKKLKPRHTLLIIAVYDRPGVLRDVLSTFADRGLNLEKLHSRSSVVRGWDYYFFLEVDCLPGDSSFKEAKKEIEDYCSIVRILGAV